MKCFAETIFADEGNPVSHAFYLCLLAAPNFCGSRPIREKRKNDVPRKFGAIIWYMYVVYIQNGWYNCIILLRKMSHEYTQCIHVHVNMQALCRA